MDELGEDENNIVESDLMATMNEEDYDRQWRSGVDHKLDVMTAVQQQTSLTVNRVDDRMKDLMQQIDRKVNSEVYESMMARLNDRLVRLEGGSQKFLTWFSVAISGCALLLTALGMAGAAILYMVSHHV